MIYELKLNKAEAYMKAALFVAANIALPHLFHLIPGGGVMFLPIYFFTIIAAMRYGWQLGLLTAVMTPLMGNLIFGAPVAAMIPDMLLKGAILSASAALAVKKMGTTFAASFCAVLGAWLFVGLFEWPFTGAAYAFQDLVTGVPGLILMIVGSYLVNKL